MGTGWPPRDPRCHAEGPPHPATLLCFSVLCKEKISQKMSSNFFLKYKVMKGYTLETENLQPVSQLKVWLLSQSQSSLWFHEVPMSNSQPSPYFLSQVPSLNSRQFQLDQMNSKTYILLPPRLPAAQCSIRCLMHVLEILTQALMLPREVLPCPSHPIPASDSDFNRYYFYIP